MSYQVVSCHVVSCRVVSCRVVSCRVVSCRVVSCRVVSCRVVSCRVVSCRILWQLNISEDNLPWQCARLRVSFHCLLVQQRLSSFLRLRAPPVPVGSLAAGAVPPGHSLHSLHSNTTCLFINLMHMYCYQMYIKVQEMWLTNTVTSELLSYLPNFEDDFKGG